MESILDYLTALEQNNNAEWYRAHKSERDAANAQFEALLAALIDRISAADASIRGLAPKELTFKQVRDTRFSHDKSPYNPSLRAHIGPRGKLPIPVGYYISIRPGCSFLGGGLFADMFKDATEMIRRHIAAHGDELNAIVADAGFASRFTVRGSALKNVPRGYDPDSPYAEWIKYKCLYVEYPLTDAELTAPDFLDKTTEIFLAMKPFNDFLNAALKDFVMPARPQ